jgi:hypothetical protein
MMRAWARRCAVPPTAGRPAWRTGRPRPTSRPEVAASDPAAPSSAGERTSENLINILIFLINWLLFQSAILLTNALFRLKIIS